MKTIMMFQMIFMASTLLCFGNSHINTNPRIDIKINQTITKPDLYALCIGATPPNIKYTEEDARDVDNILINQEQGGLYGKVITEKLTGADATAANILKRIGNMALGRDITRNDVFILFIASHGYLYNGDFRIQASDFQNAPSIAAEKTSVSLTELLELLDQLEAKKIIFLDACYSGNIDNDLLTSGIEENISIQNSIKRIINTKAGYTVITSSLGTQKSYWHEAWKNGAFTEAFTEGLNGKANKKNHNGISDNVITIGEICDYIAWRVPELCREQNIQQVQHPDLIIHDLGDDFPFFNVNDIYKEDARVVPLYGINTQIDPLTKRQCWEHISDILFCDEFENGERYLTGEVNFMGMNGILGLRVKILIKGDAFHHFGPIHDDMPLVIYLENGKKLYFHSRRYSCRYNKRTDQTEYILTFDMSIENERHLHQSKVEGVEMNWITGKGQYKSVQADQLIKQLNNIKKAKEHKIISKRRRNRK